MNPKIYRNTIPSGSYFYVYETAYEKNIGLMTSTEVVMTYCPIRELDFL